jgi:hypothetical protein
LRLSSSFHPRLLRYLLFLTCSKNRITLDIIISDLIQQNLYGIFVRAAIEESNREIVVLIIMAGSRMMYGNTPTAYTESNIVQVFCGGEILC